MEFESLRAIWNTQNERPVFSLNDSRLAVALYQQREQSRRRLFRQQWGLVFGPALVLALFNALLFLGSILKNVVYKIRVGERDPGMSVFDGVALAGAAGVGVAIAVWSYRQHKKHELTQDLFAPSLREELEQGIAQLDFELNLYSGPRVTKLVLALSFQGTVLLWEVGRVLGDPAPWYMLAIAVALCSSNQVNLTLKKKVRQRMVERRRALESMLAQLKKEDVEPRREP